MTDLSANPDRSTSEPYLVPDAVSLLRQRAVFDAFRRRRRRQLIISLALFLTTCLTTTLAGAQFLPVVLAPGLFDDQEALKYLMEWPGLFVEDGQPIAPPDSELTQIFRAGYLRQIYRGLEYSIPLMVFLLCHELGHFLQAIRYRVPATFPFFIPLPLPPFGTMGAVIAQGRGVADRRQMFDIAVTGPLAGLVVALPALYLGVQGSSIDVIRPGVGMEYGEPLVIQWMIWWIHGPTPEGYTLYMNGLTLAGWVGVFITALNLLPIGQLDGGHLTYTMLGKVAHWIAILLVVGGAVTMYLTGTYSYMLMLVLILVMGTRHPPTRDDTVPLGLHRHIIGWLTLSFLIIGFTPTPIIVG